MLQNSEGEMCYKILGGQRCIYVLALQNSGGGGRHPPPPINTAIHSSQSKVHSCSVDPQKYHRNYLITSSILKFPTTCRFSLQRRSFDIIYIYI